MAGENKVSEEIVNNKRNSEKEAVVKVVEETAGAMAFLYDFQRHNSNGIRPRSAII